MLSLLEPVRKPQKTITLEIPNLPTLAGLVIKPGDKVLEGQPIARYVNDTALELQQAQLERAMLAVNSGGAELTAFKTVFVSQQASLETKLASAREMVDADAEPPVKLALAKSSLRKLEAQNLERLSGFTSRQAALERSVQAAKAHGQRGEIGSNGESGKAMGSITNGWLGLRGTHEICDGQRDLARGGFARTPPDTGRIETLDRNVG